MMSEFLTKGKGSYLGVLHFLKENSIGNHNTLMLSSDECMILYSVLKDLSIVSKVEMNDFYHSAFYSMVDELPDRVVNESYVKHLYNSSIIEQNKKFLISLRNYYNYLVSNYKYLNLILHSLNNDIKHIKRIIGELEYRIENKIYKYGNESNYKEYCESIKREENINKILRDGR